MASQDNGWVPARTLAECDALLTSKGMPWELDEAVIGGRKMRVWKHQQRSTRAFWLQAVKDFKNSVCVVFEDERYTYGQVHEKASRLADFLHHNHGVTKGDRVALAMRNYPEYLIAMWGVHLLGAVVVFLNAWSPPAVLQFCILNTTPKAVILDTERAPRIAGPILNEIHSKTGLKCVLIARSHEAKQKLPAHMQPLEAALAAYNGPFDIWKSVPEADYEENATIFFTSGTTGMPKGVLSSQRAFLQNTWNALYSRPRMRLRNGESLQAIVTPDPNKPPFSTLLGVPLFHVTGCTSTLVTGTKIGGKLVLMRKWDRELAARLIMEERCTNISGVPSMALDLIESSLSDDHVLETVGYGGAPATDVLAAALEKRFKTGKTTASQGYGLTETNAIAVTNMGMDYLTRPGSTGIPPPPIEIMIADVNTGKAVPPNSIGEVWIRGQNLMKGYWHNPKATAKAITPDGWFKSGDIGTLDEEGFLYIRDRIKDIIIRGGENIDSTTVENAIYADTRIIDCAAVSVPDKRLGELVAAVAVPKPSFKGQVSEAEVIAECKKHLPNHCVPVMVMIVDEIERNANGKILKDRVRKFARVEWARRLKKGGKKETAKL